MSKLLKKDLEMKEENKDDFKESVILRKNLTNEFTISDIEKHLKTLNKMKIEGEGTMKMAVATADNVLRNNEFINDLSDEQQHAVWMYFDNRQMVKEIEPQLENVKEEIKKHNEYLDVIYSKFGFQDKVSIDLKELADDGEGAS